MADMQMAIGLWRKTRNNFFVLSGLEVTDDYVAYEIAYGWGLVVVQWMGLLTGLKLSSD